MSGLPTVSYLKRSKWLCGNENMAVRLKCVKIKLQTNMLISSKKLSICIFAALLSGCVTNPTPDRDFNHLRITEGMSGAAVLAEMGAPISEESVVMPGQNTSTRVMRYVARVNAGNGDWLEKDLTIFLSDGQVVNKRYIERRVLKTEKDSRPSNNIIQLN